MAVTRIAPHRVRDAFQCSILLNELAIGIVRLRFEPSTLPEHSGKRTVVLRVLDILEPIRFWSPDTNEEKPLLQVGELVPSDGVHGSTPLSFNLDDPKPYRKGVNKVAKLLKFLWESDPLLGRAAVGSESVQSSAAFHSVSVLPTTFVLLSFKAVLFLVSGMGQLDRSPNKDFGSKETSRKGTNATRSRSPS